MVIKKCLLCGKKYEIYPYRDSITKFCSMSCNLKDKKIRFKDKIKYFTSESSKGNKYRLGIPSWNKGLKGMQIAWNKGIKANPESIEKMRLKKIGVPSKRKGLPNLNQRGEKHWNWKGGITDQNRIIRNSAEYRNWRRQVFERDRFSCVECGYRSCKRKDIRADHIKPFCKYPELRFEVTNGRTLCIPCDLKLGYNYFRDEK